MKKLKDGWLDKVLKQVEEETKDWPEWKMEEARRQWRAGTTGYDNYGYKIKKKTNSEECDF